MEELPLPSVEDLLKGVYHAYCPHEEGPYA